MSIAPQTFVRLRTDPTRAGVVTDSEVRIQAGEVMVEVRFASGHTSWVPESALELVRGTRPQLAERFADGLFADPGWLRRTLSRIRVTGRLSDMVYSMEATGTDFHAYQFKPVLKLLNSPTDGLLIADEVGLGKTIEAGLIWTELRARLEADRLLVVCPKTLCVKWQVELDRRFGVDARIVDAAELADLLARDREGRGFAAIASMPSLRPPRDWKDPQAQGSDGRRRLARMLDEGSEDSPILDLLVIDEAHHLRNPETKLYELGQLLNSVTAHRVFLSATPIHLRNRDLHTLLNLIDADTFAFESTLEELIKANEPLVKARDLLLKPGSPLEAVLENLETVGHFELVSESKTIQLIGRELARGEPGPRRRAELASLLEQVNQLANYVARTRRRDVEEFRVTRTVNALTLEMHELEREFYDAVTDAVAHYAVDRGIGAGFLLSMPQRLVTSSPAAASHYWAESKGDLAAIEETDEDTDEGDSDQKPLVGRLASLARELDLSKRLALVDTKYNLLKQQLKQLWADDPDTKVIVFSSFKPTLDYLRARLSQDSIDSELLHGSVAEPRDQILSRFRDSKETNVLLSSEVASEGVDLQFSWVVFNYDLPWNPMKLEQRIGRVDRLGQPREAVVILNLIYDDTIDWAIYKRLYVRLGLGEKALGEFEAVLGNPIRELQSKLINPALSEAEKMAAIDQTAQAIENLKIQEEELEEQAGALARHGDYVLQKIEETKDLHRYLSADDILVYIRDRLQRTFPGCAIEASPPGSNTHRIVLSSEARDALGVFLTDRGVSGSTKLLTGDDRQRYLFTASVAQGTDRRVEPVSQMHPLVRFASELDAQDEESRISEPVGAVIRSEDLAFDIGAGLYVVGIRSWAANVGLAVDEGAARLAFAGAAIDGGTVVSPHQAEALATATATHGRLEPNFGTHDQLAAAAALLREKVMPELDGRFDEFVAELRARIDDRASVRRRALTRHRDLKAVSLREQQQRHRESAERQEAIGEERRAKQFRALAAATQGKLDKLERNYERQLRSIERARELTPELSDVAVLFIEVKHDGAEP